MLLLSTASVNNSKDGLARVVHMVTVDGNPDGALFQIGSTENVIDNAFVICNSISIYHLR